MSDAEILDSLVRVKGIGLGAGGGKAMVNLTARMIDTTTGEIMISAKGAGEAKGGKSFDFSSGGFGVGGNESEWRESSLGNAQENACNELVKQFVARVDRLQ